MRCALFLLGTVLLGATAGAQDDLDGLPVAREYLDAAGRLIGRAMIHNRAHERLEELCDGIGHRLSGSPGAEAAVRWCLEEMAADGLANVRGETVLVPHWVRGHCRVRMTAPREADLTAIALGNSVGTDGPIEAEVLPVHDVAALRDLPNAEVEGRIVLFTRRMERGGSGESGYGGTVSIRTRGPTAASELGALASMNRSVGTDRHRLPHTGTLIYGDADPIPAVALADEDASLLARLADRGQEVRVSIDLGCQMLPDVESANVVAEVVGRERPEEVVVISGHLDSWDVGAGALDDGAGCVIAWEAARLLLELGMIPRRTVRVVLYMNEENGLRGGRAYLDRHREAMGHHVAAIESDSGAGRPQGFSVGISDQAAEHRAGATLRQIAALLRGIGAEEVSEGGAGGADISVLKSAGVPCLGLRQDTDRYFDYHHTPADTLDKVDPHDLSRNVAAMAVMAYILADLDTPLGDPDDRDAAGSR